jgi:hypothetical protein
MPRPKNVLLGLALLLWAPLIAAQNNLGELLDAGAKKLSVAEFKEELVQRVLVGPTPGGGSLELMYAQTGSIQGLGKYRSENNLGAGAPVSGEWTTDDNGRICTTLRVGLYGQGSLMPPRCQFWFRYRDQYFISDSDTDRSIKIIARTLKQ